MHNNADAEAETEAEINVASFSQGDIYVYCYNWNYRLGGLSAWRLTVRLGVITLSRFNIVVLHPLVHLFLLLCLSTVWIIWFYLCMYYASGKVLCPSMYLSFSYIYVPIDVRLNPVDWLFSYKTTSEAVDWLFSYKTMPEAVDWLFSYKTMS